MIVGERLRERLSIVGLSQSALARLVGVQQPTITRLISGEQRGTTRLHLIARELGTTPAYLNGETDNPNEDAPPLPEIDPEARDLLEQFSSLSPADRRALLQVAKSMASGPPAEKTIHDRGGAPHIEGDEGRRGKV